MVTINKSTTASDLIQFYQGCFFSPSKSTFLQAAKNGNFVAWQGLTMLNINKHYTPTVFTAKVHLDQERKNLQSTKVHPAPLSDTDIFLQHNDFFPKASPHESQPTHDCMALLLPFTAKTKGYMDLTGRFPYTSARGNQYILIIYDYDSNCILATATKSRQSGELT